jgi:excisionase family DNA binding protein
MSLEATLMAMMRATLREVLREELRALRVEGEPLGEFASPLEAARRVAGCSVGKIRKWIRDGALPAYGNGRMRRVEVAAVRHLIRAEGDGQVAPDPQAQAVKILRAVRGRG